MKNDNAPIFVAVSGRVPQFLKIKDSGQIVQCKGLERDTLLYEVELPSGEISKIHARKISTEVTPEEEAEFRHLQNKQANKAATPHP